MAEEPTETGEPSSSSGPEVPSEGAAAQDPPPFVFRHRDRTHYFRWVKLGLAMFLLGAGIVVVCDGPFVSASGEGRATPVGPAPLWTAVLYDHVECGHPSGKGLGCNIAIRLPDGRVWRVRELSADHIQGFRTKRVPGGGLQIAYEQGTATFYFEPKPRNQWRSVIAVRVDSGYRCAGKSYGGAPSWDEHQKCLAKLRTQDVIRPSIGRADGKQMLDGPFRAEELESIFGRALELGSSSWLSCAAM